MNSYDDFGFLCQIPGNDSDHLIYSFVAPTGVRLICLIHDNGFSVLDQKVKYLFKSAYKLFATEICSPLFFDSFSDAFICRLDQLIINTKIFAPPPQVPLPALGRVAQSSSNGPGTTAFSGGPALTPPPFAAQVLPPSFTANVQGPL